MNVSCPRCGATVGEQIGGKLGLALAGVYFGNRVHPVAALAFGVLGALIGHQYIDSTMRICPKCGQVLRIANDLI
jgi:ribosomal protein S27AE